jgi:hypothetical protein
LRVMLSPGIPVRILFFLPCICEVDFCSFLNCRNIDKKRFFPSYKKSLQL